MRTFLLPDLGEGLKEAEIVDWHVAVGDRIVADQPLVAVETDKAVVEVPAPWSGVVRALHGAPGDMIAVGAPIVDIEDDAASEDRGTVVGALPRATRTAQASQTAPAVPAGGAQPRPVRASPAVRKLASDLGVDLGGIAGTGPDGAVTRPDVEAAVSQDPADISRSGYAGLRGVRRAMAESMTRAGREVVPATVTDEAVIESWPMTADLTIRLVKAVAAGCAASPGLNAWFDGDGPARRLHDTIDLGIAMQTDDGLFVPVLRNIAARDETDLRAGLDAMKRDVAQRSVPRSQLRGQTITLSNFGMLGGLHAALVIVPPQVAILGAGRVHMAARVVDGDVRAVKVLPLSLTFDHRAVAGAEAVRCLRFGLAVLSRT